jgi:phospholipid transport system transporter-binding protein
MRNQFCPRYKLDSKSNINTYMNTRNKIFSIEHTNNGVFNFVGELNYSAINNIVWEESKQLLEATDHPIEINLSGITRSDSTGVAFLVAWTKLAAKKNKSITLTHIPQQMRAIIRVSGLESKLPL